ncbi:SAP49_1 [Sanghuangporus sanghuang]
MHSVRLDARFGAKVCWNPTTSKLKDSVLISYIDFESAGAAIEAMNGQSPMNKAITVWYAFEKDGMELLLNISLQHGLVRTLLCLSFLDLRLRYQRHPHLQPHLSRPHGSPTAYAWIRSDACWNAWNAHISHICSVQCTYGSEYENPSTPAFRFRPSSTRDGNAAPPGFGAPQQGMPMDMTAQPPPR